MSYGINISDGEREGGREGGREVQNLSYGMLFIDSSLFPPSLPPSPPS